MKGNSKTRYLESERNNQQKRYHHYYTFKHWFGNTKWRERGADPLMFRGNEKIYMHCIPKEGRKETTDLGSCSSSLGPSLNLANIKEKHMQPNENV